MSWFNRKYRIASIGGALALAVLGAFYYWSGHRLPEVATIDPECDLQRSECRATLSEGRTLTLGITPRPILPVTPLTLEVRLSESRVEHLEMELMSPLLRAGSGRIALTADDTGVFRGRGTLPVCVSGRRTWNAIVRGRGGDGPFVATFAFETRAASNEHTPGYN